MTAPIRLLVIAPTLDVVGGQSVQAARLMATLEGTPNLHVTFLPSNQPLSRALSWIKRFPYARTIANAVVYWARLFRHLAWADVVHVFTPGLYAYQLWTVPVILLGRLYRKPVVVNYHDGRAEVHLQTFRGTKRTLLLAAVVITPSEFLVDVFRQYGVPAEAIFNIIDSAEFPRRLRRRLRPKFLTNRGLEPLYNVACVLRAFATIQHRYPEASLKIAHDGSLRRELEALAKGLDLENVTFLGSVPQHEMARLYDDADIYMMSPDIDNMPLSILECYACGLPIISTDVGGISYIARNEETALLVGVNDHLQMASSAFRLLEEDGLAERLTAAGIREVEQYSPARIREKWLSLYRRLSGHAAESGRIRLLFIAPTLHVLGGQSVQAVRLREAFRAYPELDVDFLASDQEMPRRLQWIRHIPYIRTFANGVLYWTRLVARTGKADLVHIFTPGLTAYTLWTIPALLISSMRGKRIVVNYRDGRAATHLKQSITAKPTLLLADRIVTPSRYLVDVFGEHKINAQSIPNVVDPNQFRYRVRRKLRPVFLTNRGLEELYNVGCVLRAFALIQQRHPDAELTVAHDGSCRHALEDLAKELRLRNVWFIGKVPPAEVASLYDCADIYMMSPNIDNMPGSILECYASGVPIITTNAGGIPYMARHEDTALLVELNDHKAMAHWACRLLEDEELTERLSAAGRAESLRYKPDPVSRQWLSLYRELLEEGDGEGTAPEGHAETRPARKSL